MLINKYLEIIKTIELFSREKTIEQKIDEKFHYEDDSYVWVTYDGKREFYKAMLAPLEKCGLASYIGTYNSTIEAKSAGQYLVYLIHNGVSYVDALKKVRGKREHIRKKHTKKWGF